MTNRKEFIKKIKETSFYQEFVDHLYILQGETDYVYYAAKKAYASADVNTTSAIADEYQIIFSDIICLNAEERSRLIKL